METIIRAPAAVSYTAIVFVPTQLEIGSEFSILTSFKSGSSLSNLTAKLIAASGIIAGAVEISSYEPNSEREMLIKGKISAELAAGVYPISLVIMSGDVPLLSRQFKLSVKEKISESVCGNNVCEGSESADDCIQDCHCGDFKCQSELGENMASCYGDCQYAPFSPVAFWAITLVIALLAIGAHLYKDVTKKARELEKYFKARLKRGEKPESIRHSLMDIGYSGEHVSKTYEHLKKKTSRLRSQPFRPRSGANTPQKAT
jgi:hypothetical protein